MYEPVEDERDTVAEENLIEKDDGTGDESDSSSLEMAAASGDATEDEPQLEGPRCASGIPGCNKLAVVDCKQCKCAMCNNCWTMLHDDNGHMRVGSQPSKVTKHQRSDVTRMMMVAPTPAKSANGQSQRPNRSANPSRRAKE